MVDYKAELGIKEFPVILVFSRERLDLLTYEPQELYEFLEEYYHL